MEAVVRVEHGRGDGVTVEGGGGGWRARLRWWWWLWSWVGSVARHTRCGNPERGNPEHVGYARARVL